jgi:hypothetical protein
MVAIDMEMPTDCKKCPLAGTDGIDKFSPMMCIAIWATKREIKHCVGGKILDDCPLVEIVTCKDCKHWKDSDGVYRRGIGAESKCPINTKEVFEGKFYCANGERRE